MSDDQAETFDLNSLDDQELTEQVHDDLYNGLKDDVVQATNIFLARGWAADKVLNDALVGCSPTRTSPLCLNPIFLWESIYQMNSS